MPPHSIFGFACSWCQFPEEKENRAVEMAGHNDSLIHHDVAIFQHLPEPLRELCPKIGPTYSRDERKAVP